MLVAIAIPIFTTQLEKSRDAVTVSNLRAAYAEAASEVLTENKTSVEKTVVAKGQKDSLSDLDKELPFKIQGSGAATLGAAKGDTYKVTFDFSDESAVKATVGDKVTG